MDIFQVTFVVLLILKLTSIISVSWWLVFTPLIIGFVIRFAFELGKEFRK